MPPILLAAISMSLVLAAQTAPLKPVMGSIVAHKTEASELTIKPDQGDPVVVKYGSETTFQRVAPGERDLRQAQPAKVTDLAVGDRLLVTYFPDGPLARRIILMAATDISQRHEADRRDWTQRGLAGLVTAKSANEVTLKIRNGMTESTAKVLCTASTDVKRYAPDSVKFNSAVPSSLAEIKIGDQLRAKGKKSEDGTAVEAEAVVFGTFQTRAGTVTAIDAASGRLTIKDLTNNKPLTIVIAADSQVKAMPQFGGMPAGGRAMPAGGGPPGMAAGPPRPGMAPDLSQMIERMPTVTLDKLSVGQTVVVSSTKGAKADEVTAILLLSNADMLLQMAAMSQQNRQGNGGGMMGGGMGMGGGLGMGGLDLSGMTP